MGIVITTLLCICKGFIFCTMDFNFEVLAKQIYLMENNDYCEFS